MGAVKRVEHTYSDCGISSRISNAGCFEQARQVIPGGVNSPVRAFQSVGGTPCFLERAAGSRVYDVEGKEYVDLVCSWGPALLGHAHPEVVEAVQQAAARGLSFGAPTECETLLAQKVCERVPAAEQVRFVSTGTEATMTAIRIARGATERDLIVKFSGHYHGHSDGLLAAAGSGLATGGLPGSAGVPRSVVANTIVLPYNDFELLRKCFAERGQQIAAVIVEAAAANMGCVPPVDGFNAEIRALCTEYGALMIVDEVLTGFRVASGGWLELDPGYVPDLITFGKVVGGGMPLAAIGGKRKYMDLLAPNGPVYQAGTLSGNPLATAAGLKTLQLADAGVYQQVLDSAKRVAAIVSDALSCEGVAHRVQWAGSLFSFFFGPEAAAGPLLNYEQVQKQESWRYPPLFHAFLEAGVALPPSVFEVWFLSSAHNDADLERIEAAAGPAAQAAAAASRPQ